MKYEDIIKQIAKNENSTEEEIEKEMEKAISFTDLSCSAKEFIETVADILRNKDYI